MSLGLRNIRIICCHVMIMAVPTVKNGKLNWCWRNQQGQWDVGYRDAGKILLVMFCLDIWFVFSHTQLGDAICLHWYGRITTWLIAHNSYFMLNFSPNSSDSRWRRSMKRGAYWSLPSVELHGIPLASYHDSRASLYQKELESTLPFYGCHFETCHCCRNVISNCVHSQGTQLRWVAVQTLMRIELSCSKRRTVFKATFTQAERAHRAGLKRKSRTKSGYCKWLSWCATKRLFGTCSHVFFDNMREIGFVGDSLQNSDSLYLTTLQQGASSWVWGMNVLHSSHFIQESTDYQPIEACSKLGPVVSRILVKKWYIHELKTIAHHDISFKFTCV